MSDAPRVAIYVHHWSPSAVAGATHACRRGEFNHLAAAADGGKYRTDQAHIAPPAGIWLPAECDRKCAREGDRR
jgi:hypothetical protein